MEVKANVGSTTTSARTSIKVEVTVMRLRAVASTGSGRCPPAASVACCPADGGKERGESEGGDVRDRATEGQ